MKYVILDLEWNTAFVNKEFGFINEIIEIGAVKFDDRFNAIQSFTMLVKPKYGKKLSGRVKSLTNITNDELMTGKSFAEATKDFEEFLGRYDSVICTWGNTDIRTLIDNCKLLLNTQYVPFLKKFCDLQFYFQKEMSMATSQQLGLSSAAELLGISSDELSLHRALDDCILTAKCIKKIYDENNIKEYISICDNEFYKKLFFKAKTISDIKNRLVDKNELYGNCPTCGKKLIKKGKWVFKSDYFRAPHICNNCGQKYIVSVKFRKLYDGVSIRKKVDIVPKEA